MPLFHFSHLRDSLAKTYQKAQADIDNPSEKANVDNTIKDLRRCGDLVFETPKGKKITCPYQDGRERLDWLLEQVRTHMKDNTERSALIAHIRHHAHQGGFLFAGQNGVKNIMMEKGITEDLTEQTKIEKNSSTFSLKGGHLSYIETYHLHSKFVQPNMDGGMDRLSSNVSLATVTTRSHMQYDAKNLNNPIAQKIDKIDISIKDKLALKIFSDGYSSKQSEELKAPMPLEKLISVSDKRGFFKKFVDYVTDAFSALLNPDKSKKPKI